MQTKNSKLIYSVFSGSFFSIPDDDVSLLTMGQLPLLNKPKNNCKKCFGKGHNGRDINNFSYNVCSCIKKNIDFDSVKKTIQIPNI